MKQIITIEKNLDCCEQIDTSDIPHLKESGYTLIICARYDGEEEQQVSSHELEELLKKENLRFAYLPFSNHVVEPEKSRKFYDFCKKEIENQKTLAFCRTGSRITFAWDHYSHQ